MRSEIEKLINRWRGADNTTDHVLSELQAILDADPVARLEVMGWRLFVDRYGRICWNRYGDDGDGVGIMSGLCLVAADVAESAKAILARIEAKGE